MVCEVRNKHYEKYDVYIGRGSKWGNDWSHKAGTKATHKTETVEEAIAEYKKDLWRKIRCGEVTLKELRDLDGKSLGCYCSPRPCHGTVIAAAVEWAMKQH